MSISRNNVPARRRRHAKKRARERYGLEISSEDLSKMVDMVQEKGGTRLYKQSVGRSAYRLSWGFQEIDVLYCHEDECILTFLPFNHNYAWLSKEREKVYIEWWKELGGIKA